MHIRLLNKEGAIIKQFPLTNDYLEAGVIEYCGRFYVFDNRPVRYITGVVEFREQTLVVYGE